MSTPHDDSWRLDDARWPERFLALAAECRDAVAPRGRHAEEQDARRTELWTIANLAIQKYVRIHFRRFGTIDPEDVRDISSAKTLDLLRRLEQHEWEPGAYTPAQLCAFVATVARNGVLDHVGLKGRETQAWWDEMRSDEQAPPIAEPLDPGDASRDAEAAESAGAIAECLAQMTPRARFVWLLRVFYDMSSEEVARHPDLRTTPAAVDTMLLRCRRHMQRCAREKGLDPGSLPVGTLTTLWEMVMDERSGALARPGSRFDAGLRAEPVMRGPEVPESTVGDGRIRGAESFDPHEVDRGREP